MATLSPTSPVSPISPQTPDTPDSTQSLTVPLQMQSTKSAPPPIQTRKTRAKTIGTYTRSNSTRTKSKKKKRRKKRDSDKLSSPRKYKDRSVPRKLGPRDVGRIKYKQGTKYDFESDPKFLAEKIHKHARGSSFLSRKAANPVQKKETVEQVGTPNDWKKPDYYKEEVAKMYQYHNGKRQGWGGLQGLDFLEDKPSKPRDTRLEALKDTHIPKGQSVKAYGSPNAWKPINYAYENTGGGFLDEKFWFEGSHVQVDGKLAKLIEALPPKKKLILNKLPAPTGYQSKINFLRKLRDMVVVEVQRIHREDMVLQRYETKRQLSIVEESEDNGNHTDAKEAADDFSDLSEFAKEVANDLDKQMDDALNEVLGGYADDDDGSNKEKKKKVARFGDDTGGDGEDKEKRDSLHMAKKSTMTLEIDVNDAINDIDIESDEDFVDDDEDKGKEKEKGDMNEKKYKQMLRRKKSQFGINQRKLLTMQSVHKLSNLIDDMEKQSTE